MGNLQKKVHKICYNCLNLPHILQNTPTVMDLVLFFVCLSVLLIYTISIFVRSCGFLFVPQHIFFICFCPCFVTISNPHRERLQRLLTFWCPCMCILPLINVFWLVLANLEYMLTYSVKSASDNKKRRCLVSLIV